MADGLIETYAELLEALKKLTPEQLQQKPQAYIGTCDDSVPVVCKHVFSIGTVRDGFEVASEDGSRIEDHQYVRDASDGKHHSDAVVMQMDCSGYESVTENRQLQVAKKALGQIVGDLPQFGVRSLSAEALARAALDKIEKFAEKEKARMLKECV